MTNRAFLVILPEASTEEFVSYAREFLADNDIVVEEEVRVPHEELVRGRWVEKQYPLVRTYALADSCELNALIHDSEEVKSKFFNLYNELWDTVMEEGRLLTAKDAMVFFGDLSPGQMENKWWGAFQPQATMQQVYNAPTKLIAGMYISRLGEGPHYVINGFYPSMAERWTIGPRRDSRHSVTWMALAWPESRYSVERVETEVFGVQDPEVAFPSSLRQALYAKYEDFKIYRRPSLERCGFELSTSPLEALARHCMWTRRPLSEMPYGRQLLQESMPPLFLERVLSDPLIISAGMATSFFDTTSRMPNSKAIRRLTELFYSIRESEAEYQSDLETLGEDESTRRIVVYDVLQGCDEPLSMTEGCDQEVDARRNTAVIFIKPHAYQKLVFTAIGEVLAVNIPGMSLDHVLDVEAHLVETRNIIDRHYGSISYYAQQCDPATIQVSEERKQSFEEAFGVRWKDAAASGRMWNAKSALQLLGHISAKALYELWTEEPVKVKVASGAFICRLPMEGGGVYIINGFYPFVREMFVSPGARTRCYIVSWPEKNLSWKAFRSEVIGCTNPAVAPPTSLRGMLYRNWQTYGLSSQPDTTANSIHASAGPIEGLVERNLWFGIPYELDVLTQQVIRCGFSPAVVYRWAGNPLVTVDNTTDNAFDLLENCNTSEIIEYMRESEEQLRICVAEENALNRAVVFLHPHSTTHRTIAIVAEVLERAGITIITRHNVFAHQATAAMMDTASMQDIARYCSLSGEALMDSVSYKARETFETSFDASWLENMESVVGADDAIALLHETPFGLMKRFSEAKPVKLDRHVHAAYLKKEKLYVVNGFYPYLSETYTTPGSFMQVLEVAWKEAEWTWEDFNRVVIGDLDVSKSAPGSLQRVISENWKDFGMAARSVYRAQCNVSASQGPLEAVVDRLRWFSASFDRPKKLLEDPFIQNLLLEGVPAEQIKYLMEGYRNLTSSAVLGNEREKLQQLSSNQQTSIAVTNIKKYSTAISDSLRMEYGFIWVQPSAATDRVRQELSAFLSANHIRVLDEGRFSIDEAGDRNLLNAPSDPLYRNAMVRHATEMPISPQEKLVFKRFFGMEWETAVQLSLVYNSAEYVQRVGGTAAVQQWERATKKTCISPSLYIAYVESEGLYVVNGFYSFLRARLYNGPHVLWYTVAWEAETRDYQDFLGSVIGETDPALADTGSFRRALNDNWESWGLRMPPDALENGIYACRSPLEALSERCRWLGGAPEEDVLGKSLVRNGVHARFLQDALENPLVHLKGDPVSHVAEVFDLMPFQSTSLCETLVALQTGYEVTFLPSDTIITQQRPHAILDMDDDGLWEEPDGFTETEKEEYLQYKEVTLVLRRGVSAAYEYNAPLEDPVPVAARQWWLSGLAKKPRIPQSVKAGLRQSFAILCISPTYAAAVGEGGIGLTLALLKDLLQAHSVSVLVEREVPGLEAEARHVFDFQFERFLRYSTKQSGNDSVTAEMRERYHKETGIAVVPGQIRNAMELAAEFNLTARKLERVWEMCVNPIRLGTDLFMAKVPTEDIFLVNGFALQFQEKFMIPSESKRFLLVSWDSAMLSYEKFMAEVIGDRLLTASKSSSFHGVLRNGWSRMGIAQGPHPYMGVVTASESALQAMQQRQAWLGTGLVTDPLGREALTTGAVSPLILRLALRNPPMPPDGTLLMDELEGEDGVKTLERLRAMELTYRKQPMRNTAFVLVKPHALCKRFARRVEHTFAKHRVTIDEQGDVSGQSVHDRGLVRYLYPAAAGYAVRNPTSLILTEDEQRRIYDALNVTWEEFVLSDMLLNAYTALEALGGITPQQLYVMWKSSRHRVLVRPDLEITELDDHHIFVVNAFFPALKQSFETPSALLHWYVISWSEKDMSWATFNNDVAGARQPSRAEKDSIRGHLFRHWREYGLHSIPDRIQNGIHLSEGPLQGLGERLTFLERPIAEDPLGEVLERMKIHPGLLESWLDNPDVQVHQTTAGVFEHVTSYDTSRLIRTLEFLSDDIKAREAYREQGIDYETSSIAPEESTLSMTPEQEEEVMSVEEEVETMNMSWRSDLPWTEEPIVYRNSAVLLVKPHVMPNTAVRELLLEVLKRHKIRVTHEVDRESTSYLVDRLCFTEAFFAMRSKVEEVLANGEDVTQTAKRNFRELFGERWEIITRADSDCRLISAKDAMHLLRLSAQELHVKCTVPGQLSLAISGDVKIVQVKLTDRNEPLYVVNPSYPYYRQRLESADGKNVLSIMTVSFDSREHTWKDFRAEVIGDRDPSQAMEGSFRHELYHRWDELHLPARPNEIDNGVHESTGALQAFGERLQLFGTSDLIPDPLVRSMCMADADPLLLVDWSENPLVAYTSSYSHGEEKKDLKPKICRVFDLLYEMDTRDLSELIRTAETHIRVLSRPKDLRLPDLRTDVYRPPKVPLHARRAAPAPRASAADGTEGSQPATSSKSAEPQEKSSQESDGMVAAAPCSAGSPVVEASEGECTNAGPAPPEAVSGEAAASAPPAVPRRPRVRRRLHAAVIQDAILNAKDPEEVAELWEYYRAKSSCPDKKVRLSLAGFGPLVEVPQTIDFLLFHTDYAALEMYGAPLEGKFTEITKLFKAIGSRESGQMNYNEFARALALYQTI